ncbi:uncharacterized protein CLUP02_06807 [Colletotrichum lupini]|uniref:Uncharacterized protein n=1 Tax=Colletotrichum lupini TaxID=145971 RepID=A0A9Q8WFG7_9PEZI|nr:uncharacterized protein CLUP02_06807 [Colletotrichum lupini]UQC81321.1 hypothetical protein CLUP02_06807 [Colletotrichum lupini]
MEQTSQDTYYSSGPGSLNKITPRALLNLPSKIVEHIIHALCQSCQSCDHGCEPTVAGRAYITSASRIPSPTMPWFVSEVSSRPIGAAPWPTFDTLRPISFFGVYGFVPDNASVGSTSSSRGLTRLKDAKLHITDSKAGLSTEGQAVSTELTPAWGGSQLIGKLPNITSLHIHGITQLKFLNDPPLLECCRSLEVFIFSRDESPDGSIIQELSWNNWSLDLEITPRQIVDQISIKVPKALKHLVIGPWFGWEGQYAPTHVYYRNRNQFMQEKLAKRNVIGSLRHFRNLEEVHLCQDVVLGPPKCMAPDENGYLLLETPPLSLKKLKISGTKAPHILLDKAPRGDMYDEPPRDLFELHKSVQQQSLMSDWPRIDEKDLIYLTKGFKQKGVAFYADQGGKQHVIGSFLIQLHLAILSHNLLNVTRFVQYYDINPKKHDAISLSDSPHRVSPRMTEPSRSRFLIGRSGTAWKDNSPAGRTTGPDGAELGASTVGEAKKSKGHTEFIPHELPRLAHSHFKAALDAVAVVQSGLAQPHHVPSISHSQGLFRLAMISSASGASQTDSPAVTPVSAPPTRARTALHILGPPQTRFSNTQPTPRPSFWDHQWNGQRPAPQHISVPDVPVPAWSHRPQSQALQLRFRGTLRAWCLSNPPTSKAPEFKGDNVPPLGMSRSNPPPFGTEIFLNSWSERVCDLPPSYRVSTLCPAPRSRSSLARVARCPQPASPSLTHMKKRSGGKRPSDSICCSGGHSGEIGHTPHPHTHLGLSIHHSASESLLGRQSVCPWYCGTVSPCGASTVRKRGQTQSKPMLRAPENIPRSFASSSSPSELVRANAKTRCKRLTHQASTAGTARLTAAMKLGGVSVIRESGGGNVGHESKRAISEFAK